MAKSRNETKLKRAGIQRLLELRHAKPQVCLTTAQRDALLDSLGTSPENIDLLLSIKPSDSAAVLSDT